MKWIRSEPLSVERITVAIADLPPSLLGIKIVQLSDFHYHGAQLSDALLKKAVAVTNQEKPDLIVLTGDFITHEPTPINQLAVKLTQLQSRLGIYAVLGNHDLEYPTSQMQVTKALNRIGIKLLWNEIAYPFGQEFPVVGLADYWSQHFHPAPVFAQIDPQVPRLVLSHNPDSAAMLQQWRVDLQLSGHTHGGQIILPGIGPLPKHIRTIRKYAPKFLHPFLPYMKECHKVVQNWEWSQGWHRIGKNQLYVNRGLGSYFPGRFRCAPEVSVITLDSLLR